VREDARVQCGEGHTGDEGLPVPRGHGHGMAGNMSYNLQPIFFHLHISYICYELLLRLHIVASRDFSVAYRLKLRFHLHIGCN
jgi:hypothetical protein